MARPGLDKHPKFRLLCRLLGEPRPHLRGYLELLWESAYESGEAVIGSAAAVEAVAEYPGEAGRLFRALLDCGGDRAGFIEPVPGRDGVYQVHDLYDHAPEFVQRRHQREAERRERGETVSSMRAKAGRAGGLAKARKTGANGAGLQEPEASDGRLVRSASKWLANGSNGLANVATPSTQHSAPSTQKGVSPPSTPSRAKPANLTHGFERFWDAYPRRVAKRDAARAWAKIRPDAGLVATILAALERHKRLPGWLEEGGQYIPHPATWLNKHRWADETPEVAHGNGTRNGVGPSCRLRAHEGKYAGRGERIDANVPLSTAAGTEGRAPAAPAADAGGHRPAAAAGDPAVHHR
jgi:hypothetical protein